MLAFEHPFLLAFLLLIPAFIALRRFLRGRGVRFPIAVYRGPVFSGTSAFSRFLDFCRRGLLWFGFALAVVAAAGPARVERHLLYLSRGNEVIFALDISPSMAASDFVPTRLEAAKSIIALFLSERRNETVGLVAFGGEAALVCPPTLDYEALRRRLADLQPGALGEGTAIGSGLGTAVAHENEVDGLVFREGGRAELHGLRPVAGGDDAAAEPREKEGEELAIHLVVLREEDVRAEAFLGLDRGLGSLRLGARLRGLEIHVRGESVLKGLQQLRRLQGLRDIGVEPAQELHLRVGADRALGHHEDEARAVDGRVARDLAREAPAVHARHVLVDETEGVGAALRGGALEGREGLLSRCGGGGEIA